MCAVAEDWRVTVTLQDPAHAGTLRDALHDQDVEDDVRRRLGEHVVVSESDAGGLFLYTVTQDSAHEGERVVGELLAAQGLAAEFRVDHWHPIEERWEDENVALPATEAQREAEEDRLEVDEVAESQDLGGALWEVRVELASHHDAVAMAEKLEAERETILPGWTISVERRWKYLIIGADNEEQAGEIVAHVQRELPAGATIHAEPSGSLAWQARGNNPFAYLGGLGV